MSGRSSGTVIPPPLVRGGQHIPSKHNSQIVMPPLVRGAQVSVRDYETIQIIVITLALIWRSLRLKSFLLISYFVFSLLDLLVHLWLLPLRVCCYQPIAMTPQQIASLRQQQQQHSGSGPPPLLLAPRASVPNVQVQGQRIIQQGLIRVANVANSNVMVNIPQVRTQYTSKHSFS